MVTLPASKVVRRVGWGLLDQSASSATNFLLFVAAGRLLGPDSLGIVALAFASYLVVLGFARSLAIDPLVVRLASDRDPRLIRSTAAWIIVFGASTSVSCMVLGAAIPGSIGRGLFAIGPWIIPVLVQDLWRATLFCTKRESAATLNDFVWLAALLIYLYPTQWSPAVIMVPWGLGAVWGAALGFFQLHLKPSFAGYWHEWRSSLWTLGRWLTGGSAVFNAGAQGSVFVVAGIVGAAGLGGLRAAQSLFAPMTVVAPAFSLPGLPAVGDALLKSRRKAGWLAVQLSGVAAALAGCYLIVLLLAGNGILSLVFGGGFDRFNVLLVPIGLGQIVGAIGTGPLLVLKAGSQGKTLFIGQVLSSLVQLIAVIFLAQAFGLVGAAWAFSIGTAVSCAYHAVAAIRFLTQFRTVDVLPRIAEI